MAEWQWKRWDAVARVEAGKLTMAEATQVLGLSGRQVRRLRRALERDGRRALRHGNRGRAPVNKLAAEVRARVVALRREKYRDFNDQHFAEKLAAEHPPIVVSVATVRRLLRTTGVPAVWPPAASRTGQHGLGRRGAREDPARRRFPASSAIPEPGLEEARVRGRCDR